MGLWQKDRRTTRILHFTLLQDNCWPSYREPLTAQRVTAVSCLAPEEVASHRYVSIDFFFSVLNIS